VAEARANLAGLSGSALRSLPLARSSCAKARNLMSVLFNNGVRHDIYGGNPVRLVRQSAKREKIPSVLSVADIQKLLPALPLRERMFVLLDSIHPC
jgi:site-specific recombinase XerD